MTKHDDRTADFAGSKMALYIGRKLAVILRDEVPDLVFPGLWDLPGGGREGHETPLACALRECHEELGLRVPVRSIRWQKRFVEPSGVKWFFVAELPQRAVEDVVFGDEGQCWTLMDEPEFIRHPKAIAAFRERVAMWRKIRGVRARY